MITITINDYLSQPTETQTTPLIPSPPPALTPLLLDYPPARAPAKRYIQQPVFFTRC